MSINVVVAPNYQAGERYTRERPEYRLYKIVTNDNYNTVLRGATLDKVEFVGGATPKPELLALLASAPRKKTFKDRLTWKTTEQWEDTIYFDGKEVATTSSYTGEHVAKFIAIGMELGYKERDSEA